ncbi:MAG: inositol monophosphatase [Chloroflexota bacterium]|nr:MAG: inositol monophosphatase [Chloroflexota bacterium]
METLNLSFLESLARRAGEIVRLGYNARPGFGSRLVVNHKGVIDLVTDVDHRSEDFLLGEIRSHFPSHRILSEESGRLEGVDSCAWYVDPLDGTVNFAHGIPIFAVSVAFAEDGAMRFGVVYDPTRDECFTAERGKGAWLNGEPVRASEITDLDHSLLATGFPYDIRTNPANNLDNYARFAVRSQAVRRLGSAALDACYVAAGRFDGYWELGVHAWDVAAAGLIAEEAGARVTDAAGGPEYLLPGSILVANPAIHAQMLAVLG